MDFKLLEYLQPEEKSQGLTVKFTQLDKEDGKTMKKKALKQIDKKYGKVHKQNSYDVKYQTNY